MSGLQKFWDQQYSNPDIVSGSTAPRQLARRFLRFVKKQNRKIEDLKVLDLGCGNGRHAALFFEYGAKVWGWDISPTAIGLAKIHHPNIPVESWQFVDMAKKWPDKPDKVDIILDIMSFHHIMPSQVQYYIQQAHSRLADGGLMFLYTFNRAADKNAEKLISQFAGPEPNTYILPGNHHPEHVISSTQIHQLIANRFDVVQSENIWGFQYHGDRKYKRRYQKLILRKKDNE